MSQVSAKPPKMGKILRQKGQEFLASRKNANNLAEIMYHFECGADLSPCLLTVEMIFTNLLKDGQMYQEIIPLKPKDTSPENLYKDWLKSLYEKCWTLMLSCLSLEQPKIQIQALATAMKILSFEGKYPLEPKGTLDQYLPLNRFKLILKKLLSNDLSCIHLIDKFQEYISYDDVLMFTWKLLPSLTDKCNPNETYILNYLSLLEKLPVNCNQELQLFCCDEAFNFEEHLVLKCLNKVWSCLMLWEHNAASHKQLLIILLEKVLPHLDKPLLMTDFLMDSLDVGGSVSLLALQGMFTMIQVHNLDYPNIFGKLYSMFEPEIFHTKFKARLFYLANMFLSSTHLPESMVAAFAKRLARLALVAPTEDVVIICMFIGNLILRHPGLKCLLNRPTADHVNEDPFIMEERDPVKSRALESSLWELQSLQVHAIPKIAIAAKFINNPLPNVEWDISKHLDDTCDDIFDKEIKRNSKLIALAFDRPNDCFLSKGDVVAQYWNF